MQRVYQATQRGVIKRSQKFHRPTAYVGPIDDSQNLTVKKNEGK